MDWHRVRHVASGILVVGALVSGGTVGNVLLLGSADYAGDPVGHLSARSGSQSAVQSTADDPASRPLATMPSAAITRAAPRGADSERSREREVQPDD